MERIFRLPISILKEKDNKQITHHYTYYSGNEYEINISHIRVNGKHYLSCNIIDNINKSNEEFKIRSITQTTINELQEKIDTHLSKLGITTKFINSWQRLIDEHKEHLDSVMVIEIKGDKVITKNGEEPMCFWQEDKSVEEINNIFIENYNNAVESYREYIINEDGE